MHLRSSTRVRKDIGQQRSCSSKQQSCLMPKARQYPKHDVLLCQTCRFGDRVRKWTTFNEPWIVCGLQYGNGDFAPGVDYGDVGKWRCGHNLLIAHAVVVKLYRDTYKKPQDGRIGMALWSEWSEPWSDKPEGAGLLATCICDGLPADCITHVLQRCAIPMKAACLRIFCCCCHLQTSVQLKTSWTPTLAGLPTPYTLVTIQNMCVRVDWHCGSTGHTVPEQVCA